MHDHVVAAALPQRFDDFFTPLQRAVGRRDRATGFKLCSCRQQVNGAVGIEVFWPAGHGSHGGGGRRIRVNHHQQIKHVHGTLHFQAARLRVRCMAPEKHGAQVGVLVDEFVFLHHAVNPARHGDAGLAHHGGRCVAALDPVKVNAPALGKMLPRAFGQAVVAGQRVRVGAHVGGALHIVVTPENIGAAARLAHVAQRQLQNARGPHDGIANRVLGLAHAPHDGRGPVHGHHLGRLEDLRLGYAAGFFHLVGRPLGQHFFLDLVHAVDTVVDVLLVFPAVLEDVVQHAKQEWNV